MGTGGDGNFGSGGDGNFGTGGDGNFGNGGENLEEFFLSKFKISLCFR